MVPFKRSRPAQLDCDVLARDSADLSFVRDVSATPTLNYKTTQSRTYNHPGGRPARRKASIYNLIIQSCLNKLCAFDRDSVDVESLLSNSLTCIRASSSRPSSVSAMIRYRRAEL